jgi:hypothetical protein
MRYFVWKRQGDDLVLATMKQVPKTTDGIHKTVGRRTKEPNPLSTRTSNKAESLAWRKALGGVRVPKGVFRFRTHEEADEWLWRMITRPIPR